jgi:hypothetical protein
MTAAAERHLLFGLLALQNGLIDQGQLVLAFQAWTRDKARSLTDQLVAQGDLDADASAGLEPPLSHQSSSSEGVPPALLMRRRSRSQILLLGSIPPGP